MKKLLRVNVIIVCFLLIAGIFPLSTSAATITATESYVQTKINNLKALFPDESYFTTTGTNACKKVTQSGNAYWCSGGTSCETCRLEYLFSNKCTNNNIKTAINQVPALNSIPKSRASCCGFATFAFCYIFEHDYLTNSTAISTANAGITNAFLSSLKPGDLIKCYTSMTSTQASHWAIFLGYDDNYVYLYESNNLRPNRVEYNNKRPRNGLKLKSDGSWVKLVAFRSNTHTSKIKVNDTYKVTAVDGFLSIRSTNDTSGTKLGTIPTGAMFTVTKYDNNGNWGYVTYNGVSGWSCLYDVEFITSSSNPGTGSVETKPVNDVYCITAPDGVQSIRTQPATSSTKIGEVPNNKYITVTQYANDGKWDWGYTTYNGQSGWVCLYYATKHASHSFGSWQTVTAATCTTNGSKKRVCACGAAETDAILALGHNYSPTFSIDKAATCTTVGSKSKHCTRCSASTEVTSIPATGHSYGAWTIVTEATCTSTGLHQHSCSHCGNIEYRTIAALGHDYSLSWTIDKVATCTTVGSKSKHCTRCSASTEVTSILATGHSYGVWSIVTAATCSSTGLHQHSCSRCGNIEYRTIAALGHDYSLSWTIDKAAACTVSGIKSHHCTRCSTKSDVTTIPAADHSWSNWTVVKQATNNETGINIRKCTSPGCSAKESAIIAKLSLDGHMHNFGEWGTEIKATCDKDGRQKRTCLICKIHETREITASGHIFGEWMIEKNASCTEDGIQKRTCSVCYADEKMAIDALDHRFGEWITKSETNDERILERKCNICEEVQSNTICFFSTSVPHPEETPNEKENGSDKKTQDNILTTASPTREYGNKLSIIVGIVILSLAVIGGIAATILISRRKKA